MIKNIDNKDFQEYMARNGNDLTAAIEWIKNCYHVCPLDIFTKEEIITEVAYEFDKNEFNDLVAEYRRIEEEFSR